MGHYESTYARILPRRNPSLILPVPLLATIRLARRRHDIQMPAARK
jgi:hypothetical protein